MKKQSFLLRVINKAGLFGIAALLTTTAMAQIPLAETQYFAQQGNPNAQHNLGVHYFDGDGVPQDYRQAAAWFGKAAQQGHAGALYVLADLHEEGLGVNKSISIAKDLAKKACGAGNKSGCDMYNRINATYK